MKTSIYLDHLSLIDISPLALIDLAGQLGCGGVSLMVTPVPLNPSIDLLDNRESRKQVAHALRNASLGVGIVEPFILNATPDWPMLKRTADFAAEIGGMVNALGFDDEPERLKESLYRLHEITSSAGTSMTIEAFPLSQVKSQKDALQLAQSIAEDVGLCVDTLHVIRAGESWDDVAAIPKERIRHVQINDGPLQAPEDRYVEAAAKRLPPGEGEFNLEALIPLLPASASLAVEAPFDAPAGASAFERAKVLVEATWRLIEKSEKGT